MSSKQLADGTEWKCDTPENIRRRMSALQESRDAAQAESARQLNYSRSVLRYLQADCPHESKKNKLELGILRMVSVEMCADCGKVLSSEQEMHEKELEGINDSALWSNRNVSHT